MPSGKITLIHIASDSGEPMGEREEVEAVAGRGLRGDRYFEDRVLWNHLDPDPSPSSATDSIRLAEARTTL